MMLATAVAAMAVAPSYAQTAQQSEADVVTLDSRFKDYRQGEVLVKFKTTSGVNVRRKAGKFASSGVTAVDDAMRNLGISEIEELMPLTGELAQPRRIRTHNGNEIELKDMSRLYRVRFDITKVPSVEEAVAQLQTLADVEYAEPNYLVYTLAEESVTPNDPFYTQQYNLGAINMPALWEKELNTAKRPVIAILDTGVDIEHPDLKDNIWTNTQELNGAEGSDDDGNGFADDVHGWDFVNQTGRMRDFNGHGTHCAGIAAAVGNNGIGIVGANPDALIMPVTVMQSDGVGDIATIIKGIDYATANGASVISMSFGGYAYSIAEEQALARAYSSSVLVAAAGNDNKCIYPHKCPHPTTGVETVGSPMFPAAFTFVFGVQATTQSGTLAGFSNFDEDGPIAYNQTYFNEEQMYNYELQAPGVDIYSTFPGGKYKSLSGTSMACPLVAGAISRLMTTKEILNKEYLLGDLIHTSKGNIDILGAFNVNERNPKLSFVTFDIDDSMGDGDGRPDAGEKISIYPVLRNAYGTAENIKVWITLGELEDETIVTFLDATEANFGQTLSAYAKARSEQPFQFEVSKDCVDGRHIKFVLHASCDRMEGEITLPFTLTVENGVEIGGMIKENTTLKAGVNYIVTNMLAIPSEVTLTIEPGTTIKFSDNTGLNCDGNISAKGTPEQPIIFTKRDLCTGEINSLEFNSNSVLEYVVFDNIGLSYYSTSFRKFEGKLVKSIIRNSRFYGFSVFSTSFTTSLFLDNIILTDYYGMNSLYPIQSTYSRNIYEGIEDVASTHNTALLTMKSNNITSNLYDGKLITAYGGDGGVSVIPVNSYLGTSSKTIARSTIWDINLGYGFYDFDLTNMLTAPNPDAPGILWKVVVNGFDAQDEFELLPPLGVGTHKFEVYYSQPQDKSWEPTIAMGVRPPYTQTSISEKGSWNEDGTIYTAYLTLTGKMAIDGLNRIYVSSGKNADKFFDIPLENMRFNVLVSAAGSMSTGFEAEAGLGKVNLRWEEQDENVDDILGYNLYRYQTDDAGVALDTIRINEAMLDVTEFTDFDVVPGETYNYYYKIMRTSLTENSPSHVVAATPLTASKGDANGTMSVDVTDIVTIINYMTNQNPQPFIFEAADVNSDLAINILDVVGTVNIIIKPVGVSSIESEASARYTIENGVLYLNTPIALAGVQFELDSNGAEISLADGISGFENTLQAVGEGKYIYLAFSMSGKTFDPGKYALLNIGNADVTKAVLSDRHGNAIVALRDDNQSGITAVDAEIGIVSPNPFTTEVAIPYSIGEAGEHEVSMIFTDLAGRIVDSFATTAEYGTYSYSWRPSGLAPTGIYFVTLYIDGRAAQTEKVIRVK